MDKFNPTKAQREMIKFIFSRIKTHKEHVKKYGESAGLLLGHASGVASFMWVQASTPRETRAATRVYDLVEKMQHPHKPDLPCFENIKIREHRQKRIKQRLAARSHANSRQKVGC